MIIQNLFQVQSWQQVSRTMLRRTLGKSKLIVVMLFAGIALATGCGTYSDADTSEAGSTSKDQTLKILCTTSQIADALRNITAGEAEIAVLMGPGVDPHSYEPLPSNVLQLEQADIIFYNGLHLEGRIVETLEKLVQKKTVVAVTDGLLEQDDPRLLKPTDFEGLHDPHVWHDVALWADCVRYACERLAKFDPTRADEYKANLTAYLEDLRALDTEVKERMATIPASQRLLVTAHDAFNYFSKAYDIETVGLKGISTEDQADFAHLNQVRQLLVDRKVPAVFVESSTSPRLIEKLIEECQTAGHEVRVGDELYSDAMGPAGSGADEYVGMIQANVRSIVAGLTGE